MFFSGIRAKDAHLVNPPERQDPSMAHLRLLHGRSRRPLVLLASAALGLGLLAPVAFEPPAAAAAKTVTLWATSAKPAVKNSSSAKPVEIGVRFRATQTGDVLGVRFYKGSKNTGTHTGSLWSASGKRLATVKFTGETASGWQTARFAKPVAIRANTTYVASYFAPKGHQSYTRSGFSSARTSGPLVAPAGTNSVYTKASKSAFPTKSYKSTNYWVDVLFRPTPKPSGGSTSAPVTPPSSSAPATPSVPVTSASPAPTAAVCGTSAVWANLDACGWAGPSSTGYPAGQVWKKTVTGGLTVSTDGTVIDGYNVTGGITVKAKNVTIRNSWVRNSAGGANGSGVVKVLNGASATIDHSVLDGQDATHTCIWHEGASMTATNNECIGANDGIFSWATTAGKDGTGDNFLIENNWLHDFTTTAANGHVDGFQTEGAKNGVIRHNTFDVEQGQTSAIAIWNGRKSADNIQVVGNLIQGGGFSIYAEDYNPSEASPAGGYTVTNVSFTNNRFSNSRYACVGDFGVWFTRGAPTDGWRRSGNVLLETGQNLDTKNPVVNGWECR
jgi:hypothetical protein